MFTDYYEILGVNVTATEDEIKKAYRQNAVKFHPDKHFDDPFFTKKFQEIMDAYSVLGDKNKRASFDLLYHTHFQQFINKPSSQSSSTYSYSFTNPPKAEKNQSQQKSDEKFRYDPHKQFYSPHDREQQETPQFNPINDLWGNKLQDNLEFFKLPKKIGKIISGFSDLTKNSQALSVRQKLKKNAIFFIVGLSVGALIYFLADLQNLIWIAIWFTIPSFASLWFSSTTNGFAHTNFYTAINGFAQFSFKDNRENLVVNLEVNFEEMTDLYSHYTEVKRNYVYQHTDFVYVCLNRINGKILLAREGAFKKNFDVKSQGYLLNFYRSIERYWTVYLLDRLEKDLKENGHITFSLYSHQQNAFQKYIKLSVGSITFLKQGNQEFTYNFNDIKKIYSKGSELIIQHKNFEKTMFFFKSGNEDVIPLTNLCNRQFFYKAVEILLGYSI